jgi:hypothetical protein
VPTEGGLDRFVAFLLEAGRGRLADVVADGQSASDGGAAAVDGNDGPGEVSGGG